MATFIGLDGNPTYTEGGERVILDGDAAITASRTTRARP